MGLTLAITADLHWGINESGDAATRDLISDLAEHPPDLLIVAGDIGAGEDFERCLRLFESFPNRKALVPGNHDIWVTSDDRRGDSWELYSKVLPALSARFGFHYLDHGPLVVPEADLAIVGSMNWYDYSWTDDPNWAKPDDWDERLRDMRFTRGRHNDRRFVRWQFSDQSFTAHAVATLERHLVEALDRVSNVIVVTHHPAFEGVKYPEVLPPHLDQMMWRAFSGNRSLERVLEKHAGRIALVFSGHTHKARESTFKGIPGFNIGGDYGWKRLLKVTWPARSIEVKEFRA
jgi:3',5'-cyclic AMP phosphodiesterase CpdA